MNMYDRQVNDETGDKMLKEKVHRYGEGGRKELTIAASLKGTSSPREQDGSGNPYDFHTLVVDAGPVPTTGTLGLSHEGYNPRFPYPLPLKKSRHAPKKKPHRSFCLNRHVEKDLTSLMPSHVASSSSPP